MCNATIFLALLFTPGQEAPAWSASYWQAQDKAKKQNKPLVVIIGSGPTGHDNLIQGAKLSAAVQKTLTDHYVAVYLNALGDEGKSLTKQLGIKSGVGLVISDRSGMHQAFNHDGHMPERDLAQNLERYRSVQTMVSFYPPVSINGTYSVAPAGRMRGC